MKTAPEIIDGIGVDRLCELLGVGREAVWLHRRKGVLPGLWYAALCEETGERLPFCAFYWRRAECRGSRRAGTTQ